ncbi:hypothetical protein MKZ38_009454 [Zalerion maritima]|uniref:Tim44-like domain-containing protein n=1 Tax=Zalerion maritima TaxID=339359 RepID=A0AAD5RU65_9PEZI|nr:hypothetical protein MKZ38_009454 [Zalerion maritima]
MVFPPFSAIVSQGPKTGVKYIYYLLKYRFSAWWTQLGIRWGSATSFFPPKFRFDPGKSRTPGLARDMHAQMNTYLAEGNLERLSQICTHALQEKFKAVVNKRKKSDATKGRDNSVLRWEVLRYEGRPKIVFSSTFPFPKTPALPKSLKPPLLFESVVRIKSVQRLARWKPTTKEAATRSPSVDPTGWEIVSGTEKVHDASENVVIQRQFDPNTYMPLDGWKFWGTIGHTQWADIKQILDLESMEREKADQSVAKTIEDMGLGKK